MHDDKFTADELPHRTLGVAAGLRRTISREISVDFDVIDDYVRQVRDDVFTNASFHPKHIEVRINLDSGQYHVALSGPWYFESRSLPGGGRAVFPGKDFLDADEHHNSLVIDAVVECLRAHGKVA